MVERKQVFQSHFEQLCLRIREVARRFHAQHAEGIDHRFRGAEVHGVLAGGRVRDLAEEQAGVLGLEQDEFIEARIGFGGMGHGDRFVEWRNGCKDGEGGSARALA